MVKARGCDSCRASRVKCDNRRPICGRCARLQRECTGYRDTTDLIIVQDETQPSRPSSAPTTTSNEKRDTISRSRYVPPQHYASGQKLPWLRDGVSNELKPRLHDIAVSRFFANYVLYPNRHVGDDGYLPDLPYFYSRSSDGSTLQSAVRACALASFAHASGQSELLLRARRAYGEALESLRKSVVDVSVMKRDDTLMSVLVLDFFALLTDETPAFLGPHSYAIADILRARGDQQIRTTVGWNLFRVAHRRVQHRRMFNRTISQPINTLPWFLETAPAHIEARLGYNGNIIVNACQRARDCLVSHNDSGTILNTIEELHRIAVETSAWTDLLPSSWLPWTCKLGSSSFKNSTLGTFDVPQCVHYSDIWIANTWNCHRTYQVHLHETVYGCYNSLSESSEGSDRFLTAANEVLEATQSLLDEMLDSVPFLLGLHQIDARGEDDGGSYHPELGSYYAFGVTECVGKFALASESQKELGLGLGGRILERWKKRSL